MAHTPRHDDIIRILHSLKKVTVQELTERLQVSEVTIRKDLGVLEEMGRLVRTHGGAQLAEDSGLTRSLAERKEKYREIKKAIARQAAEFIREGDTIYLDAGSTCLFLAREIREMNLRVLTNSIEVMVELADMPGISLFSTGGSYRKAAGSFIGPVAMEGVKNFHIETCFVGTSGISNEALFSAQNSIESQFKAQVLRIADRRIILADHYKLGHSAFSVFARPGDVDLLITDCLKMKEEEREQVLSLKRSFEAMNIEVILVEA